MKLYKYNVACASPRTEYVVAWTFAEAGRVADMAAARLKSHYISNLELVADRVHVCKRGSMNHE